MAEKNEGSVVKEDRQWEWSELLKKEDWWAIWLGFFLLLIGMILYFPHAGDVKAKLEMAETDYAAQAIRTDRFKAIAWFQMSDAKMKVKVKSNAAGKWLETFSKTPHKWTL